MEFETFLKNLPDCPGSGELPITDTPGGFHYITEGLPEFVGPDVAPSSTIEQPSSPRIVIVSAAGAVGKSTLANQLAYRKHAPIWDLAKASAVGENSLTGQLTNSFGFDLAAKVNEKLQSGDLFLIVDALDEARVKANEAGFEAFVQNIAAIAKASERPGFVLLGRTQTAETMWLLLADSGIAASLIAIQPFTREQARRYIENRIHSFDKSAAKRIADHQHPFVEARDLILNQLQRAVGGHDDARDEAAREFLGYAPVLETVAVLLAKEGNYTEFIAGLKSISIEAERQAERPLAVLEHVVTRLLEREQKQKLQANIKPALGKVAEESKWDDWESLYSPDEQRTRLLGRILGRKFEACPNMPPSVRHVYEEQLEAWLPEHPFLREGIEPANKVFESYLFAIAMREYLTPLSKFVEERVGARDYKPSRLLADFYILIGEQRGEEVVAERQIGLLYESLLAGETDSLRIRLTVEAGDPEEDEDKGAEGEGEFELVYAAPDTPSGQQIEARSFRIVDQKEIISFRRKLKEAVVLTRGTVSLGGSVDDFEIGPAVDIRCTKLEIVSTGIVVRAGRDKSDSNGVILEAAKCSSQVSRKPIVRGSLTVSWPGAQSYPWNEFAQKPNQQETDSDNMHEVHRRFRRIVLSLRSHSRGSLARFRDKVEHRRVLRNQVGRALLGKLLDDGIMRLDTDFYYWVPDRADAVLKVSWHDLRNRRGTPEMNAYLSKFIADNPEIFRG